MEHFNLFFLLHIYYIYIFFFCLRLTMPKCLRFPLDFIFYVFFFWSHLFFLVELSFSFVLTGPRAEAITSCSPFYWIFMGKKREKREKRNLLLLLLLLESRGKSSSTLPSDKNRPFFSHFIKLKFIHQEIRIL